MRNLAIIALKLLGILGIYWAVIQLPLIAAILTNLPSSPNISARIWASMVFWPLGCFVSAAVAFVLLTQTDWVAAKLKFPEDPPLSGIEPGQLLRVGFVVLGAFTVIDALPAIGSTVYSVSVFSYSRFTPTLDFDFGRIISPVLKFILGCILIGKSERFARSVLSVPRA
jgi:hypothetical protein